MAKIEGFRVKNFRALQDVTIGKLSNSQQARPLTPMTAVIGKNGVGKSSLFDAFGFLADGLRHGVEEACDARGRGGFERIRSLGQTRPIGFEVSYSEDADAAPITYRLYIDLDANRRPHVSLETLTQLISSRNLNHKLLEALAREFRQHATGAKGGSQIFVTTHQPYFVDALDPEEVWVLEKGADGFATIRRSSDDPIVTAMVAKGLPLGGLWYSDYLDAR